MTTIDAATIRSRCIRETILRILYNTFRANPGIAVVARHLYEGLSTGQIPYSVEAIDVELAELLDRGLVESIDAPGEIGPAHVRAYRCTAKGRDFHRAGCPWNKIDEFTGSQKLA